MGIVISQPSGKGVEEEGRQLQRHGRYWDLDSDDGGGGGGDDDDDRKDILIDDQTLVAYSDPAVVAVAVVTVADSIPRIAE